MNQSTKQNSDDCAMPSRFSRVWLCDPVNCIPARLLCHGILQARILEWVAMLSFKGSSRPRDRTCVPRIAGGFFTIGANREAPIIMTAIVTRNGFAWEVIARSNTLGALPPPAHIPELTQPSSSRQSQSAGFSPFLDSPGEESARGRPYIQVKSV